MSLLNPSIPGSGLDILQGGSVLLSQAQSPLNPSIPSSCLDVLKGRTASLDPSIPGSGLNVFK